MRGSFLLHRAGVSAPFALRSAVAAVAVACGLCAPLACPCPSVAVSPVDGGHVLIGFGQSYGGGSVHRGLDIAGATDADVRAPVAGTVSFAGAVPADGGGTVIAVTLDVADGTKVTVMPLSHAVVRRGATVQAGGSIGELADAGDASCAETHVHLSLRRGSVYLDPAPLLCIPSGTTAEEPGTQAAGAAAGSSSPAAVTAAGHATGAGASGGAAGTTAAQGVVSAVPAGVSDAGLASGVTLAPKPTASPATASSRGAVRTPAAAPQPDVLMPRVSAVGSGAVAGAAAAPTTVVHGVDVSALLSHARGSVAGYARRHVRALAIGVGALLAGVAALTPLRKRAGSGEAVCTVRPEGDAVAAAAGR